MEFFLKVMDKTFTKNKDETKSLLNEIFFGKHKTPFVELLLQALEDEGCPVNPAIHIAVENCSSNYEILGAFDSFNNQVVLCSNRLNELKSSMHKLKSIQQVLSHELIHAYDHCRAHVDFYNNPAHVMCSEIRAASLSGQCMISENLFNAATSGFKFYHQFCVKNAALASFQTLHPHWKKEKSQALLEKVFYSCFNDFMPFDRIPFCRKQAELSLAFYKKRKFNL